MKISEIGEFGLIKRLSKMTVGAAGKDSRLIVGIGDDAAAYISDNSLQLATVDSMIQDVHFSLEYTSGEELGWKSLAVNLSDIAAMGGVPRYALVSMGFPGDTDVENVIALYRGMLELASRFGVVIIGGDTVSSPVVFISVTALGSSIKEKMILRRSAAKPGDQIAVTNHLGASAAGLEILIKNLEFDSELVKQLKQAHLKPYPRIAEGQLLVEKGVKCGMDISDGLIGDLTHICVESKVGARIELDNVPESPAAKTCFGDRALEMALTGGEDYELLFTASPSVMSKVKKAMQCPVTVIGEIIANKIGKVALVDSRGKPVKFSKIGWDHFHTDAE